MLRRSLRLMAIGSSVFWRQADLSAIRVTMFPDTWCPRTVGAIAGGLKFREAQTSMLVADARSSVQVAAAEGSTRKADMRLGGLLFGGGGGAAAGGYGNTNEGKIIAAAFLDNYNNIVRAVRSDPALQRSVGTLAQEAAAGGQTAAGTIFSEGDVLAPKIAGVKTASSTCRAHRAPGG